MTDDEKVREIIKCGEWCESINKCDYKNNGVNCYVYGIAMRVAAWKEKQMIERACEWLYDSIGGNIDNRISLDVFIEDFRKAMEE